MNLTKPQCDMFWRVFAEAWRRTAAERGLNRDDKTAMEAYRHDLIRRATGRTSLKDVTRTTGFDDLLSLTCQEAELYEIAAKVELSRGRRIRERTADCLRQIVEIDGRQGMDSDGARWGYIAQVTMHAFGRLSWEDIPEDSFEAIFQILDTHRRRLLRRAGWRGGRNFPGEPIGFELGRKFARVGMRVVLAA
jgi:hypothetical protein